MHRTIPLFLLTVTLTGGLVARGGAMPVGWRQDGTGCFPDANPPLTWSVEKNVFWKTALTNFSNASPILVGDRIFICVEPETLMCLNAADGAILWQKTKSLEDVLSEQDKVVMDENNRKAEALRGEKAPLDSRRVELQAKLAANSRDRELAAKIETLKVAFRKDRKNDKLKTELDTLQKERAAIPELLEVNKELDELNGKIKTLDEEIGRLSLKKPRTHNVNGYTSCTPVSDGESVFVVYGTGVAAAYTLDGNEVWARKIEQPTHAWGHSASPVLAGGKLVVHVINVAGLDKKTGKEVWTVPSKARWGSLVATSIGGVDVVITANGDVIRADNGTVVATNLHGLDYCAPLVHSGVVYFIENGGQAYRLPATLDGDAKPELLWTTSPPKDRYYASPVYHDGLIYAIEQKGNFSVIDAKNGEVLATRNLKLGGTVYPSIAFAGGRLYVSSDSGKTVVLEPGREGKELAVNELENFRASPLFVKDRVYIRAQGNMYCIGR